MPVILDNDANVGVHLIAFLAMQVGVYPRSISVLALLPNRLSVPPKTGKRGSKFIWRLVRGARRLKII
jgi:hypothetical protein